MTFQYFSKNLAYYAPIMLILKPKLQYLSVFLQYCASKISTSTEESVWLEALIGTLKSMHAFINDAFFLESISVSYLTTSTELASICCRGGGGCISTMRAGYLAMDYALIDRTIPGGS